MRSYTYPPRRRRIGCLGWLLILVAFFGAIYWLFFSPIKPGSLAGPAVIDGDVSETQQTAIAKMAEKSAERPQILADSGQIMYLNIDVPVGKSGDSPQERAYLFLEQNSQVYQIKDPRVELKSTGKTIDSAGNTYVRFVQQYQGIEVYGSGLVVTIKKDGNVVSIGSNYVPNLNVDVRNKIQQAQANQVVLKDLGAEGWEVSSKASLQIYAPFIGGDHSGADTPTLAWFITVANQATNEHLLYVIDAGTGEILDRQNTILEAGGKLDLEIKELKGIGAIFSSPTLVMDENGAIPGQTPSENSLDAYKNSRNIYSYYTDTFNQDTYGGAGKNKLVVIVNPSECSNKAYWNGENITLCDGFSEPADVIDHEYTHAVVGLFVHFKHGGQPRELGEAFADIFAAFSAPDEFWIIEGPNHTVVRNLESPLDGFPRKYSDRHCKMKAPFCCPKIGAYQDSYPDCGHVNSVVFSHAAYLMSAESGRAGGIPREKLQYLFYEVLQTQKLLPSSNQKQAARAVVDTCNRILGQTSITNNIKLNTPFTETDCSVIEKAYQETELIPIPLAKLPKLPDLTAWFKDLQRSMRDWLDQHIGDLRQKIADLLDKLLQDLINMTKQKLLEIINQILLGIVNFLIRLINSCLGSLVLTGFVPLLALLLYQRKG